MRTIEDKIVDLIEGNNWYHGNSTNWGTVKQQVTDAWNLRITPGNTAITYFSNEQFERAKQIVIAEN